MENNKETKWKAEEVIGGNAEALRALRELIIFPHLYIQEAQKLGLKVNIYLCIIVKLQTL